MKLEPGERVRLAGHVAVMGEDQRQYHGEGGRLLDVANPTHRRASDGQIVRPVQLEDGSVVVVPERALERDGGRVHG